MASLVLDNAPPLLDLTQSAFSLIPIPGLPLIPQALSGLVKKINDARTNADARDEVLGRIKVLSDTLEKTFGKVETVATPGCDEDAKREVLSRIEQSKELRVRVQGLSTTIQELTKKVDRLKGGSSILGSVKGVMYSKQNDTILSEIKSGLTSAIDDFKFRGQLSIEIILGDLKNEALKAAEEKTLNSIPRAPADYRSVDELKSQFMEGTRQELFEELNRWTTGTNFEPRRRFYFLSGGAGLGKSSIAHQLCQRLDVPGNPSLGASFFFVRGSGDLESTRLFAPTLARQLASSQPALCSSILRAVPPYLKVGERQQMKYALEGLLEKPLSDPSVVVDQPVILVIDGLDECKERDLVPELLKGLLRLLNTLPWLQIFLTSRPEPHILGVLTSNLNSDAAAHVYHRNLDETLDKWGDDVREFLEKNVPQISPSYAQFVERHPDKLERLIGRAGGVFIFAQVALNFMDTFHDHPEEQFSLLLGWQSGVGLSALDTLYLQVLRSAFPLNGLDPSSPRIARLQSFLSIIALRRKPLTPKGMALLGNGLDEQDVIEMTDRLRSFLLINANGCPVPIHATFVEFLLAPKRCIDPLYHVNRSEGHAHLGSECLAVITLENLTPLVRTGSLRQVPGDGAAYVVGNMMLHLYRAKYSEELRQKLMDFCGLPMLLWVRIPQPYNHTFFWCRSLWVWLKGTVHAKETYTEFVKRYAYSIVWWRSILQPRNVNSTDGDDREEAPPPPPAITLHDLVHEMMTLISKNYTYEASDDEAGSEEASAHHLPRGLVTQRLGYKMFYARVSSVVTLADLERFKAVHEELLAQIRAEGVQDVWLSPDEDWVESYKLRVWRSGSYEARIWD